MLHTSPIKLEPYRPEDHQYPKWLHFAGKPSVLAHDANDEAEIIEAHDALEAKDKAEKPRSEKPTEKPSK